LHIEFYGLSRDNCLCRKKFLKIEVVEVLLAVNHVTKKCLMD